MLESTSLIHQDLHDQEYELQQLKNRVEELGRQGQYILAEQCRKNVEELEKDIKTNNFKKMKEKQKEEKN